MTEYANLQLSANVKEADQLTKKDAESDADTTTITTTITTSDSNKFKTLMGNLN